MKFIRGIFINWNGTKFPTISVGYIIRFRRIEKLRENIKLISGSYDVKISFKGIGHFKNTKDDIQYWIAFEAKETKIGE